MPYSPGEQFRSLIKEHSPLQIPGTINAYSAILAKEAGFKAIYLSGAGIANAAFGLPDLGMTTLTEVAEEARRITQISPLPLLVDIDTGWGHVFNVARTIQLMERAGVAAVHLEDQITEKRCGHRSGKKLISPQAMGDKIKAAVDARSDKNFVIMARTDAYSIEGISAAIERAQYYVELGADMLFPESMTTLLEYQTICHTVRVPVLANITEFGKTPLFTQEELNLAGVQLILYPLSAFRAMSYAALALYKEIKQNGTQRNFIETMQTREELYKLLGYEAYEKKMDQIIGGEDGQ